MAVNNIFGASSIDDLADNVLSEVDDFMLTVEKMQKRKVASNVQLVVQALKKIESDLQDKYDGVTTVIEKRVSTIKDGKDGQNGANGRDGKDGRPGRDGAVGPRGMDGARGMDGRDGDDGVSVTNAFIDFDGSLVINLSDGQSLNVGEVVAPDLAEKIKVITNGGGTSQGVLDTLTSLQNQINLISSALVYKGTWNASTNTPALASGVGTANSFYIVSVAGSTTLDGISNWGVGDWATFNGTTWQRVEGGAAGNFTDLTVSGAATLSAGEANGVAFLNGSKVLSSSSFFTYDDSTGISLLRAFNQSGTTSFTGTTNIGTSVGTSTANPFFQFQGRNDWPLPQILRFQADYVSGAASGMGLTISSRVSDGTFQNRYQLLANGTAHIWSLGATGTEQMRLTSTGLGIGNSSPTAKLDVTGTAAISGAVTLSGGTANGVTYLNGSKVLTTGSALTFDGTTLTAARYQSTSSNAALPSYGVEAGSGIFNAGASTIGFSAGSTELMRLTSTGLGIGTSSPSYKLQVQLPSSGIGVSFRYLGGTNNPGLFFSTNESTRVSTIDASGSNGGIFAFNTGGVERMRLDDSGYVGIGTSSPIVKLQVRSVTDVNLGFREGQIDATAAQINAFNDSGSANIPIEFKGSRFIWNRSNVEAMRLDSSGNLGIGTSSVTNAKLKVSGAGAAGAIMSEDTDGTTSFVRILGDVASQNLINWQDGTALRFATSTQAFGSFAERMRLDASGNLGVGTTTPLGKLGVGGAIVAQTSAYTASTAGATFGYYSGGAYPITYLQMPPSGGFQLWGSDTAAKLTVDSSGNLGLGVTPSAWISAYKGFDIGTTTSLYGRTDSTMEFALALNGYRASNGAWIYRNDGAAARYNQNSGAHWWDTAPSGVANSATITTGVVYIVAGLGASTLAQWQAFFSALTVLPTVGQSITATATGTLVGGGTVTQTITFTQAMTLDASGNLGIGETAPSGYGKFVVSGTGNQICLNAPSGVARINFYEGANNRFGFLTLNGSTGIAFVDTSTATERARIDSSGNLLVGTTTASARCVISTTETQNTLALTNSRADYIPFLVHNTASTGDNAFANFGTESSYTSRGSIAYNRTSGLTVYATTSDYRAKDISGPLTDSGALIDSVPVYMGKMKGATQERPMFIAHEVPAYAHMGEKDAVDADGNPVYQQMDASALVPVMWAEIQNLRQRLAAAGI